MKTFLQKSLGAGNVLLHFALGIGIACLFLKYERHFFLQLVICTLFPFGIAFFGEKLQKEAFNSKPNIYDAINTGIAGLIFGLIYLFVYGWKFDSNIDPNQEPKLHFTYVGIILISFSIIFWIIKQLLKKRNE